MRVWGRSSVLKGFRVSTDLLGDTSSVRIKKVIRKYVNLTRGVSLSHVLYDLDT